MHPRGLVLLVGRTLEKFSIVWYIVLYTALLCFIHSFIHSFILICSKHYTAATVSQDRKAYMSAEILTILSIVYKIKLRPFV